MARKSADAYWGHKFISIVILLRLVNRFTTLVQVFHAILPTPLLHSFLLIHITIMTILLLLIRLSSTFIATYIAF